MINIYNILTPAGTPDPNFNWFWKFESGPAPVSVCGVGAQPVGANLNTTGCAGGVDTLLRCQNTEVTFYTVGTYKFTLQNDGGCGAGGWPVATVNVSEAIITSTTTGCTVCYLQEHPVSPHTNNTGRLIQPANGYPQFIIETRFTEIDTCNGTTTHEPLFMSPTNSGTFPTSSIPPSTSNYYSKFNASITGVATGDYVTTFKVNKSVLPGHTAITLNLTGAGSLLGSGPSDYVLYALAIRDEIILQINNAGLGHNGLVVSVTGNSSTQTFSFFILNQISHNTNSYLGFSQTSNNSEVTFNVGGSNKSDGQSVLDIGTVTAIKSVSNACEPSKNIIFGVESSFVPTMLSSLEFYDMQGGLTNVPLVQIPAPCSACTTTGLRVDLNPACSGAPSYLWNLPGGGTENTQIIIANTPGTYTANVTCGTATCIDTEIVT